MVQEEPRSASVQMTSRPAVLAGHGYYSSYMQVVGGCWLLDRRSRSAAFNSDSSVECGKSEWVENGRDLMG